MKNHVWPELWPAMPLDARAYWRNVSWQVTSLWDGGGGGMKKAAELVGKSVAKQIETAGGGEAAQHVASEAARKRTEAELRAATSKPCEKLHLFQTGEYQL